jgi:hypothetical protein
MLKCSEYNVTYLEEFKKSKNVRIKEYELTRKCEVDLFFINV